MTEGLPKDAVVTVGGGRGFLIDRSPRLSQVITAAHCLPKLPPAHPFSFTEERTYAGLIGPIGETPSIASECIFVDPIADIAVLDAPDGEGMPQDNEAYESLVNGRSTLPIGGISTRRQAWLLALSGDRWEECFVEPMLGGIRRLSVIAGDIECGMSGSPIVTKNGHAIGLVSVGSSIEGKQQSRQTGQPTLLSNLPGWLLAAMKVTRRLSEIDTSQRRSERRQIHNITRQIQRPRHNKRTVG
jgi:hypothetical protein